MSNVVGVHPPLAVRTPIRRHRSGKLFEDWLRSLTSEQVAHRIAQGDKNKYAPAAFYPHEMRFLGAIGHELAAERLDAFEKEEAAKIARKEEAKARRELEFASLAERFTSEISERANVAKRTTNADVRRACYRVADLYLDSPIDRPLKQCVAIAARENGVGFDQIHAYLMGVGVRSLKAKTIGIENYEEDLNDHE